MGVPTAIPIGQRPMRKEGRRSVGCRLVAGGPAVGFAAWENRNRVAGGVWQRGSPVPLGFLTPSVGPTASPPPHCRNLTPPARYP
jgi:hypothetical protein